MNALREGIKHKYNVYHALNRDKYPDFDYNTNRANYKPLRASFEEELYEVRRLDRSTSTFHLPSINTLALIFTDDEYIPSTKILNTCRLYATTFPEASTVAELEAIVPPKPKRPYALRWSWIVGVGIILVLGYGIFAMIQLSQQAKDLIIHSPHTQQTVPRLLTVEGEVQQADEVWIVVHPMISGEPFYVQTPISVNKQGKWKGDIIIGSLAEAPNDIQFEIRAFVNPEGDYKAVEEEGTTIFDSWPEKAELATQPIVVIRKPKIKQ